MVRYLWTIWRITLRAIPTWNISWLMLTITPLVTLKSRYGFGTSTCCCSTPGVTQRKKNGGDRALRPKLRWIGGNGLGILKITKAVQSCRQVFFTSTSPPCHIVHHWHKSSAHWSPKSSIVKSKRFWRYRKRRFWRKPSNIRHHIFDTQGSRCRWMKTANGVLTLLIYRALVSSGGLVMVRHELWLVLVSGIGLDAGNGCLVSWMTILRRILCLTQAFYRSNRPRHPPHYNQMRHLVSELRASPHSWPFHDPVNAEEVTDYYDIIKEPMGKFKKNVCVWIADSLTERHRSDYAGTKRGKRCVRDDERLHQRCAKDLWQLPAI